MPTTSCGAPAGEVDNIVWGTSSEGDNVTWGCSGAETPVFDDPDVPSVFDGRGDFDSCSRRRRRVPADRLDDRWLGT